MTGLILLAAQSAGTLGYDFAAYYAAAQRVLHGQSLYEPATQVAGGFGLYLYPPPFVFAVLPFALLPIGVATWTWTLLSVAMLIGSIAILPVRSSIRWATLLLAGLSWPVAYALKLGQAGPLLLLLFAIAWRWLDRPWAVGVAGAVGAMVKLQPGLILVWAVLTRRLTAVLIGGVILVVAAAVATAVLGGFGVWRDYVALIRNVSEPITTPHNFTPGAAAYQAGTSVGIASAIQLASTVLVLVAVAVAALRTPADASLLVTIVASQLLSPVLWDHYAMLLLLPTAWLLQRRQWWAALIPLATSAVLIVDALPAALFPVAFWVALLGVLAAGLREGRGTAAERPASLGAMA